MPIKQPETDEEIVVMYKNGSPEAFKRLLDRYAPVLYNFTARIGGRNNAPDIVQEIFIKVWKKINSFDPKRANFKTWIFTIAKNTTTDFLRRKRAVLFSDLEETTDPDDAAESFEDKIPDDSLLPEQMLAKLENKEFLDKILEKLPRTYREVLLLHYQEEMTFEEIGNILDKPLNTVKSQHRRAIIELRKNIL